MMNKKFSFGKGRAIPSTMMNLLKEKKKYKKN
jgi:hypothetical protein